MRNIVRFYLVNSLTFGANILIYLALSLIYIQERTAQEENFISVLSHVLTVPISFYLNYHFVFIRKKQNIHVLVKRFIVSSFLFILFFKIIHMVMISVVFWNLYIHLSATIIVSFLNYCVLNYWVFKKTNTIITTPYKKTKLILHADDFGVCDEATLLIMDCINMGIINRASVICNTPGLAKSREMWACGNTKFEIGLHLNIVEGKPLTKKELVNRLVKQSSGEFKYGFIGLWLAYILGTKKKRKELKTQVKKEIESQILAFDKEFKQKDKGLHIDGHTHIHMLPFILDILIELSKKHNIKSIRFPNEPFYISLKNLRYYFSINMIKFLVLKMLCKMQFEKLEKSGLKYNDYLIGILSTGNMNSHSVTAALKSLSKKNKNIIAEILFHPGGVQDGKTINWTTNSQFVNYYSHKKRKKEKEFVCSVHLKQTISEYPLINKL